MIEKRMPRYQEISSLLMKNSGIHELLVTGVTRMTKSDKGTNHIARRDHD